MFATSLVLAALVAPSDPPRIVIEPRLLHLGNDSNDRFADVSRDPQGTRLESAFEATANAGEQLLIVRQRDVDDVWLVALNGTPLGELTRRREAVSRHLRVPQGVLRDGENRLTIEPRRVGDDVIVGSIELDPRPLFEALRLERVTVEVVDTRSGERLPSRIDLLRRGDVARPELFEIAAGLATRPGIAYTGNGTFAFALEPGVYDVVASRGMEWSEARAEIVLDGQGQTSLDLTLRREVETPGFIASDTHVHTLTYSGHGDSSVEERVVTIAAQGIELAVATDHNHHTEYRELQDAAGLGASFTSVIGNEVTTDAGHFTAFPFAKDAALPAFDHADYGKLVADMRGKGAEVVFLNHPRWPRIESSPFATFELNRISGEFGASAPEIAFDGIEVINANTLLDDGEYLLRDWFALLNAGHRIFAVASSDTHTVGEPVGMGRTYVAGADADPAAIDVDAVCAAYRAGNFSAAFGIFVATAVGDVGMGGTVAAGRDPLPLRVDVRRPSWVTPRRIVVYLNGVEVAQRRLDDSPGANSRRETIEIPPPRHDATLVAVAFGDGLDVPHWPTRVPYTLGIANPIFVDADGDGEFTSPRALAERTVAAANGAEALLAGLAALDDATAIQALAILRRDAAEATRTALEAFVAAGCDGREALLLFLAPNGSAR
jgi:predicted metal-dependent phosphoesterase TrpH